jgi:CRISPR-associated protein Csm4
MLTYKLHFTSPLHLSAGYGGYEETFHYLHSDTLVSAIFSNWPHFYDDDIESVIQNLPFLVSSAFPFSADQYYFPKPLKQLPVIFAENDYKTIKKLRKVNFIEKELFEKMIHDEAVGIDRIHFSANRQLISLKQDVSDCFAEREISRNAIDRVSGCTDIFHFSELVFKEDSGLFFMATFKDKGARKKFETVLRFLGDEGLGGDRNVGKGLFEVEIVENFCLEQPPNSGSILNLSLYHPTREEIENHLLDQSAYDITTRKGWITAPGCRNLRKKSLTMFREGSIFNNLNKEDYGDIPVVAEKTGDLIHFNVYRYGKGFFIGCR